MADTTLSSEDRDDVKKLREEAKSICQRLQKYGEESFFLSANVSNKLSNFSGSTLGVLFLTNRLNIIKDFYTFCIAKSLEEKSELGQYEEELIKAAMLQHVKGEKISTSKKSGSKNTYLCSLCPKTYNCNRSLQQHIKSVHSTKPFTCDICSKSFYTEEDVNVHKTMHGIGEKEFKCHLCDKRFGRKRSLNRHLKLHQGGKIYHCKHCDIKFIDYKAFKRHHLKHSLNTYRGKLMKSKSLAEDSKKNSAQKNILPDNKTVKMECEENGESSPEKSSDRISKLSDSDNLLTCDTCNKQFASKSSLSQHIQTHTLTVSLHACDQCSKSFNSQSKLEKHKAIHSQDNHRCKICRKRFQSADILEEHEKTCGSYKPKVSCNVCGEKFQTVYQLQTHKKSKHDKKEDLGFVCGTCGESFKQKYLLTRHKKIVCKKETAGKESEMKQDLKCNDCGMQFEDAAAVAKHIDDKGPESFPYQCSKCCKRFATQRILKRHEDSHESEFYKCEFCEKTFVTVGGLEQHMDSEPHFKFVCGTCGKNFGTSRELKTHSKVHC